MANVKGMLGKWVKERDKKLSMKEMVLRAGDEVVKATKSKHDDRAWAQMRDWISTNWK